MNAEGFFYSEGIAIWFRERSFPPTRVIVAYVVNPEERTRLVGLMNAMIGAELTEEEIAYVEDKCNPLFQHN